MAQRGDTIALVAEHEVITFVHTTADTAGQSLEVEVALTPQRKAPPAHEHPAQAERFTVLEGWAEIRLGRERHRLETGDVLDVPAGAPHTMTGDGRLRWVTTPAGRTEEWFEALGALDGDVGLLRVAPLLREYDDVFRLSGVPRPLQRALLALLSGLGRFSQAARTAMPGYSTNGPEASQVRRAAKSNAGAS